MTTKAVCVTLLLAPSFGLALRAVAGFH